MVEINDNLLDRHYKLQLKMMGEVYTQCRSQADFSIGERWMECFAVAPPEQKYARNCLMMLMHNQLRDQGKLDIPFTELSNVQRPLDEVLDELQSFDEAEKKTLLDSEELKEDMQKQITLKMERLKEPEVTPDIDSAVSDCGDHTSSCCGGGSTCVTTTSNYERMTERNHQLLNEISQMHARTVQNELLLKDTDKHWQQKVKNSQAHSPLQTQRGQALLIKIERGTQQAIRRLKDWSAVNGPLNFLVTCWQDVLADEPQSQPQLIELDRKLETVLDNLLEQAGERREKNVRILYDQLFEQQQETIRAKQEALLQEEQALEEARHKLQHQLHDLRHREHQLWLQQQQQQAQPNKEDDEDQEQYDFSSSVQYDSDWRSASREKKRESCNCKSCRAMSSSSNCSVSTMVVQPRRRRNKSQQ